MEHPAPSRFSTRFVAGAVFGLALAVRLAYLHEIRTIPFFEHPAVDGRVYDEWAQRIVAGNWWGDRVFYQAPAYPYFLALCYSVAGRDLGMVHVVQAVMGALSCLLLLLAGREFFDHKIGAAAGLLLALYAPAIFFDGLIQKAGLGLFLMSLFLYLAGRAQRRGQAITFALGGAALGLLALTWETTLVFLAVLPVWIVWRFRDRPWVQRGRYISALIGGSAAVLIPVAVRNYAVGRTFALTTSQMGTNFYVGNNPDADGLYAPLRPGRQEPESEQRDALELAERAAGRKLTAGQVSRYWLGRGLEFVRAQPGAWLKLMFHKWALVWNRFEVPDTEDIALYSEWSKILRVLNTVSHFGLLAPLAVAGVVLAWERRRDLALLLALLLTLAAGVAAFYVFARYRFPLVPLLALLAGAALVELGRRFTRPASQPSSNMRRLRAPVIAAALAALTAIWVNRSLLEEEQSRSVSYANLGAVCAAQGRQEEAERYLRRSLAMYPDSAIAHQYLGRVLTDQGLLADAAAHLQRWLALEPTSVDGHARLASVLARQDQPDAAITHYRESVRLRPDAVETRTELARLLRAAGRLAEAEREEEQVALLSTQTAASQPVSAAEVDAKALARRGAQLAGVGRFEEALELYRQAVVLAPADAALQFRLAEVLAAMERFDDAVAHYLRAVELDPKHADAHNNLGMVYGRLNDPEKAEEQYRLATEAAPDMLSAHYNRGTVLAHLHRYAEAATEMERCLELLPAQGRTDLGPRIKDRLEKFRAEAKE